MRAVVMAGPLTTRAMNGQPRSADDSDGAQPREPDCITRLRLTGERQSTSCWERRGLASCAAGSEHGGVLRARWAGALSERRGMLSHSAGKSQCAGLRPVQGAGNDTRLPCERLPRCRRGRIIAKPAPADSAGPTATACNYRDARSAVCYATRTWTSVTQLVAVL